MYLVLLAQPVYCKNNFEQISTCQPSFLQMQNTTMKFKTFQNQPFEPYDTLYRNIITSHHFADLHGFYRVIINYEVQSNFALL